MNLMFSALCSVMKKKQPTVEFLQIQFKGFVVFREA